MLQCMHTKLSRCCSSNLVINLREPGSLFRDEQCAYIHYPQGDNNIKASNHHLLSPSERGLNFSLQADQIAPLSVTSHSQSTNQGFSSPRPVHSRPTHHANLGLTQARPVDASQQSIPPHVQFPFTRVWTLQPAYVTHIIIIKMARLIIVHVRLKALRRSSQLLVLEIMLSFILFLFWVAA